MARLSAIIGNETVQDWDVVSVLEEGGHFGRVEKAQIARDGSVPMLDQAALEAARRSVFTPALANGRPVKVWVRQQYRFALH